MNKLSARHYNQVANLLSCTKPTHSGDRYDDGRMSEWCHIVEKFCEDFVQDNPKFKKDKFLKACNYQ